MYLEPQRGYQESSRRRKQRRHWLVFSGLMLTLVATVVGVFAITRADEPMVSASSVAAVRPVPAAAPAPTTLTGRYLFNGTIFWGRAIERDARRFNDLGHALANLSTFDRQAYDAWIADLECPVANLTVPYQRQVDLLNFNCPPEFAPTFTKYFNILNLANNHTGDQGRDAFLETQRNLAAAGAQVYGSYDPSDDTERCEVISLPVKLNAKGGPEAAALPVAFCAYHYVGRQPRPGELEYITKYARLMPTIAFAHMGIEYTPAATPYQIAVGHGMIDAGADFVVMNHPHWVQNSEAYKGKLIMYSTGNFIFDQLTAEELRSASLDVTLTATYDQNVADWTKLADTCKAADLHDACLSAAEAAQLTKPAVSYKFSLVAGDSLTNRWVAQRANASIQQSVEARADWARTMTGLAANP